MNIDTLLADADPGRTLSLREHAEIDRLIDTVGPHSRHRARWFVGVVAIVALVVTGGAAAVAATGVLHHPVWYDAASDWTTEVKTVDRVFTVDGKRYDCAVTFTLGSTYNGKGTAEFKAALTYFRSQNPLKFSPPAAAVREYMEMDWSGQGDPPPPPSKAWANQQVWERLVYTDVFDHVTSLGLDSSRVDFEIAPKHCDVQS